MREWLSHLTFNALLLLGAGVALPLVFGLVARFLFFQRDNDDVRNDPAKAIALRKKYSEGPSTPEPEPIADEPWPEFALPQKPGSGSSGS